jgi:hypothetical protein
MLKRHRARYASLLLIGGLLQQQSCIPNDYLPALGLGLLSTALNAFVASTVNAAVAMIG